MFGLRESRPVDEDIAEVEAAHAIPVVDGPLRRVVEGGMSASRLIARWKRVLMSAQCSGDPPRRAWSISATNPARFSKSVMMARSSGARGDDLQPSSRVKTSTTEAREIGDGGADVRERQHEPLVGAGEAPPDRNDAHLELPREVVDDQARAGLARTG